MVPVAINGTRAILTDTSWFVRRGNINITFAEPIFPEHLRSGNENEWELAVKLRDRTLQKILHHCGEPDLVDDSDN